MTLNKASILSVSLSGGTFTGTEAAIDTRMGGMYPSNLLKNYGTDPDKMPKHAYFDANGAVLDVNEKQIISGEVTIKECTHKDDWLWYPKHDKVTTVHEQICRACGYQEKANCSYLWERVGTARDYIGICGCGSMISITLPDENYVYSKSAYTPQVVVELDDQLLEENTYTVDYENNTNAGVAKAVVTGIGEFLFSYGAEFSILPASLSVTGAEVADREYDGTDKVKVHTVALAGILEGDDVAVDTDGMFGMIAGKNAGGYDTVVLPENLVLIGAAARNYQILSQPGQTVAAIVQVHKAKASANSSILKVQADGQAHTLRFDLGQLCPALPQGQEMGSFPAVYVLGDVRMQEGCYNGGAKMEEGYLVLPVQAPGRGMEGEIGTVSVTIQTENFVDMDAVVTVCAVKSENSESTGSNSSSTDSTNAWGSWTAPVPVAMPYLKHAPAKRGWTAIRLEAERMLEGSSVVVDMDGTSAILGNVLKTLRNRDLTMTLDMGRGFLWSVEGKDVSPDLTVGVELGIRDGTACTIPQEAVDTVLVKAERSGMAYTKLHFLHDGVFGFAATLTIQTDDIAWTELPGSVVIEQPKQLGFGSRIYAGMYVNLFSYDPAAKALEFAGATKIAEDKTVCFSFTEVSDCVLVLSKQPIGGFQEPGSEAVSDNSEEMDSGNEPNSSIGTSNEEELDDGTAIGNDERVKSVKLSKTSFVFNGKARKPSVIVKDASGRHIAEKYYTVLYKNNKKAGAAAVWITFQGKYQYKGTVKRTFFICPAGASIQKVIQKPGAFIVQWEKDAQADGYQVQYSADAAFRVSSTDSVFVQDPSKRKKTIKNLQTEQEMNCCVRIRTYKTVKSDGKKKRIYSPWSSKAWVKM